MNETEIPKYNLMFIHLRSSLFIPSRLLVPRHLVVIHRLSTSAGSLSLSLTAGRSSIFTQPLERETAPRVKRSIHTTHHVPAVGDHFLVGPSLKVVSLIINAMTDEGSEVSCSLSRRNLLARSFISFTRAIKEDTTGAVIYNLYLSSYAPVEEARDY